MLIARDVVINAVGIAGPSSSYHGGGNSRMPATAGTISARMIRIQWCSGMEILALPARGFRDWHQTCLASRISMASTHGSLRQRLALRSASAQLPTHSAWLQAARPLGQSLLGGCAAKWITTQCE